MPRILVIEDGLPSQVVVEFRNGWVMMSVKQKMALKGGRWRYLPAGSSILDAT